MNDSPRYITCLAIAIAVGWFIFPVSFTFLPTSLNTKMMLAVLGLFLFFTDPDASNRLFGSTNRLGSIALAFLFSISCYVSTIINNTSDYAYATYIVSFFVWYFAAYGACKVISVGYGRISIALITVYLAINGVFQCVTALMIDNIPTFSSFVDRFFEVGQAFCKEKDRLYGIGASLDPAGVRFSIIEILIAHQLVTSELVRQKVVKIVLYALAFFVIAIVGNMISRTTSVGMLIGMIYYLVMLQLKRHEEGRTYSKATWWILGIVAVGLLVVTYLYNTNPEFHRNIRFAFEGFFNWMETGEWRTDSTDKLNASMWIWPTTSDGWIWGYGLFDGWVYSTDIGYCRFILYCGIVGFSVFCCFFIFNAWTFAQEHPKCKMLALCLLALTFIIWIKVSTDIFLIYALMYNIDTEDEEEWEEDDEEEDEEEEDEEEEDLPEMVKQFPI